MKITKLGHCCLVIEEGGLKIMTDPGIFTVGQHELVEGIDVILFTHEHADHYHLESLKKILEKNSKVKIITNSAVAKLLDEAGIKHKILEHGNQLTIGGVMFEGFGNEHAEIYDEIMPRVQNTGYMISNRFYMPGDAFYIPEKPVEILALPVGGPWLKIKESIDYAKQVNPKKVIPVHEAVYVNPTLAHTMPQKALALHGIELIVPEKNKVMEF